MTKKKAKPAAAAEQPAKAQFDPDQPRPADLSRFPVTKAAHDFLKEEGFAKDPILWNRLRADAKAAGEQLRKAAVEAAVEKRKAALDAKREERKKLLDLRPDPDAPTTVICKVTGKNFSPKIWNRTRGGKVLRHSRGPWKGQPKIGGNFIPAPSGEPVPVSRVGLKKLNAERQRRGLKPLRSFSFAEAEYISAKKRREREGVEAVLLELDPVELKLRRVK